jgi:hypothetical protein
MIAAFIYFALAIVTFGGALYGATHLLNYATRKWWDK